METNMRIGLDIGATNTKVVACDGLGEVVMMSKCKSDDPAATAGQAVADIARAGGFAVDAIAEVTLTGVRADRTEGEVLGRPTRRVDEFAAIGTGGLALSGLGRAVVASMGTGTAFVLAEGGTARHLGGTGVGGGTLSGMCGHLYGLEKFHDIVAESLKGDISRVDLKVGDVIDNKYISLPLDLTCANFGKVKTGGAVRREDFILGLVNMILETVGVMAVLACRGAGMEKGPVVLTGALAELPQAEKVFDTFRRRTGVEFVTAEHPLYATAIGAIRR